MIFELKDTAKAEKLFDGMEDSLIRSCLQGIMGKICVTDPESPQRFIHLGRCGFSADRNSIQY